jgi:hypothetical protein
VNTLRLNLLQRVDSIKTSSFVRAARCLPYRLYSFARTYPSSGRSNLDSVVRLGTVRGHRPVEGTRRYPVLQSISLRMRGYSRLLDVGLKLRNHSQEGRRRINVGGECVLIVHSHMEIRENRSLLVLLIRDCNSISTCACEARERCRQVE